MMESVQFVSATCVLRALRVCVCAVGSVCARLCVCVCGVGACAPQSRPIEGPGRSMTNGPHSMLPTPLVGFETAAWASSQLYFRCFFGRVLHAAPLRLFAFP